MDGTSPVDFEGGLMVEKKTIKWKINNFDIIIKSEDYLESQEINFDFTDRNGIKSCWIAGMSFDPSKDTAGDNKTVVLFVIEPVKEDDSVSEINAQFWIRFKDIAGKSIFKGTPKPELKHFIGGGVGWNIESLTPETNLKLTDGTLCITIRMKIFNNMNTSNSRKSVKTSSGEDVDICVNRRSQQFYQTVFNMENVEANSDTKIVSGDGQQFFAQRWILSAVSDVFEAMFGSNMLEEEIGIVRLDDLSGATVKILLHFIYSGKLGKDWSSPEILEELIYAADKFQLSELKEYLDTNLGDVCRVENAGKD